MTLGRTSSGAIKIKTDGGLRAVECACCGGGCGCTARTLGSIVIPSDPDFAKKLRGDSGVSPFTQVSVSYSITSNGYSYSETLNGGWGSSSLCESSENIKKFADFPELEFGFSYCGFYTIFLPDPPEPGLNVYLKNDDCLEISLYDGIYGGAFALLGNTRCPDPDSPENNGQASININGVSLPTQIFDMTYSWREDQSVSGSLSLVFS